MNIVNRESSASGWGSSQTECKRLDVSPLTLFESSSLLKRGESSAPFVPLKPSRVPDEEGCELEDRLGVQGVSEDWSERPIELHDMRTRVKAIVSILQAARTQTMV